MAGYIGTKAVLLSTTAATVTGNADIGGDLTVDSNTLYVDSTNNRVGVGTGSPATALDVTGTITSDGLTFDQALANPTNSTATIYNQSGVGPTLSGYKNEFRTGTTPVSRMEISNNGDISFYEDTGTTPKFFWGASAENLLVGATSLPANSTSTGVGIRGVGDLFVNRSGAVAGVFNRINNDGDIVQFQKDGTTVGSIGSVSGGDMYLQGGGASDSGLFTGLNALKPFKAGAGSDNAVDLGTTNLRFDDVYATNGTIQTSDRNEKQDIAELDEAEKRVAVAAKGLIRKYRWKDAVAEKGDEARIHVGIIAQDLQDAFAAEGLDAGRYAMFISSTWWEHDGQTYETAEEAPEGAVERTRMGVRYPELLAFIIGAM